MNVHDAVALSAVTDLSERSMANRRRPMDCRDRTRGGWQTSRTPNRHGLSPRDLTAHSAERCGAILCRPSRATVGAVLPALPD